MKTTLGNQDYPVLNHPKTPSLQNEELAPPSKSLGFRFCTYLVLWSFFFQTLWPSVAFAHVDVPLGAAWRDAASGLTFTVQPFKDPTTHRNLVRLQAQINSKEEWAEQDVTPAKAPASKGSVLSSSLPAADNPSAEPLKKPINPSETARSALEEKLKIVLDRIVDIEALQPIPSSSTKIPYNDLSVTEEGIQWGFGGLKFVLDWDWNILSSGRAEFDMALKVCTLGTVELDNLFVKQVLAKGRDVLFSGNGRIDRMDAWATGIQGVHARPGIVRIAKDSEQRFHQIFIHQGRGENFGNLHIEESLNQTEAFQNNSHMHMDKGASVKGGSVFTNTATMEGESYSVQSALIRNEGTGDQKSVMIATESLTLVAPKLEQKGLLKSPEVDLLGVQQIEDSVDSLIDVDLLKTQLAQTWTQTGTIDAGEWQDTSAYEVFIQNKGGITAHNETSISARFRTLQGGKSDLSGVSLLNPLDRDQPLENEGEAIFRHAKDLGDNPRAIHNGEGANLVLMDSDGIILSKIFNRGHIGLVHGDYRVGEIDNEDDDIQGEIAIDGALLFTLDEEQTEWAFTGGITAQSIRLMKPHNLQRMINKGQVKCGDIIAEVDDFVGEKGSSLAIGGGRTSHHPSRFTVKTFLSQGRVQSSVPVQFTAERSIKIPGPMTLEQPTTFQTPILETGADFIARDILTLEDCYWTHQRGNADISELLFGGKDISAYGDVLIRQMNGFAQIRYARSPSTIPVLNVGRGHRFHTQKGGVTFGKISNYGVTVLEDGNYRFTKIEGPGTLEANCLLPEGSQDLDFTGGIYGSPGTIHAEYFSTHAFTGSKITTGGNTTFDQADITVDTLENKGSGSQLTIGSGTAKLKVLRNESDIILNGRTEIVTDSLQNGDGIVQSPNDHLQVLILDPDQSPQTHTYGPSLRVNFKDKRPNAEQTHDNLLLGGLKAKKDLIIEMDKCLHPAQCLHLFGRNLQCGGWLKIYGDTFRAEQALTYLGALFLKVRLLQDEGHHLVFRELQVETQKARLRKMAFIETKPDDKNPTAGTSLSITCEEDLDLKAVQLFGDGPVTVKSTRGDVLVGDKGDIISSQQGGGHYPQTVYKYGSNGSWLASNKTISVGGKNVRLTWADIRTNEYLTLTAKQLVDLVGSRAFAQRGITIQGKQLFLRFDHTTVDSGMWCADYAGNPWGHIQFPQSDPSSLQTFGNINLETPEATILGSYMLGGGLIISEHGIRWQGREGCSFVDLKSHQCYTDAYLDTMYQCGDGEKLEKWLPQNIHSKVQAGKGVKIETPDLRSSGSISGFTMNLKAQRAGFQFIGHVLQALQKAGITSLEPFIRSLVSPTGFIREQTDGTISPFRPAPPSAVLIPRHTLPVIEDLDEIGRPSTSYTFLVEPSSVLELQGLQSMLSSLMGGYYEGLSIQDIYKRFIRNGQKALQEGALIDPNAVHYGLPLLFYMESKLKEAEKRKEKPKSLYLYVPPQLQQIAESASVRSHETMTILGEDHLEGVGATFEATGPGADVNLLTPNGTADLKPFIQTVGDMADYQQVVRRTKIRAARDANILAKTIKTMSVDGKAGRDINRHADEDNMDMACPLQGKTTERTARKTTVTTTVTHATSDWEAGRKVSEIAESGVLVSQAARIKAKELERAFGKAFYDVGVQNEIRIESVETSGGGGLFGGKTTTREQEFSSRFQGGKVEAELLTLIDLGKGSKVVLQGVDWSQVSRLVLDATNITTTAGVNFHAKAKSTHDQSVFWQAMEVMTQTSQTYTAAQLPDDIEIVATEPVRVSVEQVRGQTLAWLKSFEEKIEENGGTLNINELVPQYTYTYIEKEGPTAAFAAVIALAVTIATYGAGSALGAGVSSAMGLTTGATTVGGAAVLSTAGMIVQTMTTYAFTSLSSSLVLSIANNTADPSQILKDFLSRDTFKSAFTSALSAGATQGFGPIIPRIAIGLATKEKPGDIIRGVVVDIIARNIAKRIGQAGFESAGRKAAHFGLGAAVGAALSRDAAKGAMAGGLGACLGVVVADVVKDDPNVIGQRAGDRAVAEKIPLTKENIYRLAQEDVSKSGVLNSAKLATGVAALLADLDIGLSVHAATNSVEHNCLFTLGLLAMESPAVLAALSAGTTAPLGDSKPLPEKDRGEERQEKRLKAERERSRGTQRQDRPQADPIATLDHLDQDVQGLDRVQDGLTGASFGASGFNPTETTKTRHNAPVDADSGYESDTSKELRLRLQRAEANYESVKDQGFLSRHGKALEFFDARQAYDARVDFKQSIRAADRTSRQTARVVIDGTTGAIRYVKENPVEAAGIAAAVGLTGGGAIIGGLTGVAMGMAGGGLGGLAANHYKVETAQDVLNVGASAATGAFAPARGIKALAAGMGVGAGIGAAGYATGSTPMMVDGAILGGASAFGLGRYFIPKARTMLGRHSFKAGALAAEEGQLSRLAANLDRHPVAPISHRMGQPANISLADAIGHRMQATGTGGRTLGPRMMAKDDSSLPRRFGECGRSEELGGPSASGALGRDVPRPIAPKPAVNPQGEAPKKAVRFGDQEASEAPHYAPTRKHDQRAGWGTKMDLDDRTAQSVLEKSLPAGKQRYGFHDGKLYEFQPDNVGGWHGYPILGNKAPPSVLKSLRSEGCITGAEFNKLRKGE